MARFRYTALDLHGTDRTGVLDAPSSQHVIVTLKGRGLFPTSVVACPGAGGDVGAGVATVGPPGAAPRRRRSFFAKVSRREVAVFTRQLATLLQAGMPLVRSLEVLGRQKANPALAEVVAALADHLRTGGTFSSALARHPSVFPRLSVNLVRAGEAGGMLADVLDRLAQTEEAALRLRGRIRAAMVYPLVVLGVAAAIVGGLLVFVVPRFQQIFADLLKGAPLPPLTQAVLAAADLVRSHLPALAVAAGAGWFLFAAARRTAAGTRLVDAWAVRLPVVGDFLLKALVARLARTLGTMLEAGVPMLEALLLTRDTCGNARVAEAIQLVHDRVKEGDSVARPLAATGLFPPTVTSLVEVGEQSGRLPEMLGRVATVYDEEVDVAVAGFSSLIEPALIVGLALVVGTIVIALFLPIVRIVQLLT